MTKYELNKLDFELIDQALSMIDDTKGNTRAEQLRDKFRAAHTSWLEIEED